MLAGGTVDKGEELSPKDVWNKPTDIPSINKTFQCETLPKKGKKVVYTVVNGKIAAKISQAPGAEQAELFVCTYRQLLQKKGKPKLPLCVKLLMRRLKLRRPKPHPSNNYGSI